ncbi:MAG: hypothetical protein ACYDB3_09470 [Acidimicrobiales bacterium]
MATQRSSFSKLQRDRDRQAKAAAKRDRRQNREVAPEEEAPTADSAASGKTAEELIGQIEELHRDFDAGVMDFDTFEEQKAKLLSQLPVV